MACSELCSQTKGHPFRQARRSSPAPSQQYAQNGLSPGRTCSEPASAGAESASGRLTPAATSAPNAANGQLAVIRRSISIILGCAMLPLYERSVRISRDKYLPSRHRGIQVPKAPTTIGGHLRRRRLQLKLFQPEAARRLGVSMVSLSRWERDKVYPTAGWATEL